MDNFACPACRKELTSPTGPAGETVCPHCRHRIPSQQIRTVASAQEIMPHFDSGPGDQELPSILQPEDWSTVLAGLGLLRWSTILGGLLVGLALVPTLLSDFWFMEKGPKAGVFNDPIAMGGLVMLAGCGLVILGLMFFIGMCLCVAAPLSSARKNAELAILLLISMGLGLLGLNWFFSQDWDIPANLIPEPTLQAGIVFAFLLGAFLVVFFWLRFHRAVALYLRNEYLAFLCQWLTVGAAIYAIGEWGMNFLERHHLVDPWGEGLYGFIHAGWIVVWSLNFYFWYLLILRETRKSFGRTFLSR